MPSESKERIGATVYVLVLWSIEMQRLYLWEWDLPAEAEGTWQEHGFGRPPNRTGFPSWMLCNGVASGSVRFPAPAIAVKTVETATRWARNWRGTHDDPEQGHGLIRCTLATEHIFSNFTDETKSPRRQGGKTGADV